MRRRIQNGVSRSATSAHTGRSSLWPPQHARQVGRSMELMSRCLQDQLMMGSCCPSSRSSLGVGCPSLLPTAEVPLRRRGFANQPIHAQTCTRRLTIGTIVCCYTLVSLVHAPAPKYLAFPFSLSPHLRTRHPPAWYPPTTSKTKQFVWLLNLISNNHPIHTPNTSPPRHSTAPRTTIGQLASHPA